VVKVKDIVLIMAVVAPPLITENYVYAVTIDTYKGHVKREGNVIIIRAAGVIEIGAVRCSLCTVFTEVAVKTVVSRIGIRLKTVVADIAGVR
jgi:hypothetical protein